MTRKRGDTWWRACSASCRWRWTGLSSKKPRCSTTSTSGRAIRMDTPKVRRSSIMGRFRAGMRSSMPVRSLRSSVLRWPDRREVERRAAEWAAQEAQRHPGLLRLGYFGSYARGDAGVGSDLDLIAVVESSSDPFERRSLDWDLSSLPVPAEILVYTRQEWERLPASRRVRPRPRAPDRRGHRPLHGAVDGDPV